MKLTDYLVEYADDLKETWADLSPSDKEEYRAVIEENRAEKSAVVRDRPKARLKDVDHTFDNLK